MRDARDLLERAEARAPAPSFDLLDVQRKRERRRRVQRTEALVVGLMIAAVSIAAAFTALRGGGSIRSVEGSDRVLPPAIQPPIEAAPGQFYYSRSWQDGVDRCTDGTSTWYGWGPAGSACTFEVTESETWWAVDGSGRIRTDSSNEVYGPGKFPHDTVTTALPTDPAELRDAMFDRSGSGGASPEPRTTVSPGQQGSDASVQQSIVNLLEMPNSTPALRAALLEVLAQMPGVRLDLAATDPAGRSAYRIEVTTFSGPTRHELYVDPRTHELLAHVEYSTDGRWLETWILEVSGVAGSTDEPAPRSVVPEPVSDLSSVRRQAERSAEKDVEGACSQGGPDLTLVEHDGSYDARCFVVETGSPFSITFEIQDGGSGQLEILEAKSGERVFIGEVLDGPGKVTYQVPALEQGTYVVVNADQPRTFVGPLYVR